MPVFGIQHAAIKTQNLAATNRFYTEVLGMQLVARPPMTFPGSWLSMGETLIHVLAGPNCLNRDGSTPHGGGALDHIAVGAVGFDEFRRKLIEHQLDWRQNALPEAGLWQLFVHDPNGIMIELNFTQSEEPENSIGPDETHRYHLGQF